MNDNSQLTPVLDPLLNLLRSRAFITMIVSTLVSMVIIAVPSFEEYREQMITLIVGLAVAVIAKIGAEDVAKTLAAGKVAAAKHEADAANAYASAAQPSEDMHDGDTKPMPPVLGA